jgi:phosphoribosylformylglycinamidine synthase II
MSVATATVHRALGLSDGELDRIREHLAREPNHFELAVYSLLWSEHCGYKHSRLLLRRLPTAGERVLQGPGENAGVIDVGDGLAVALKVESHNHPSAVEPFQGAATGVGGILRDIFAMGARPIALLDSLRFGELDDPRQRRLFTRAVEGIGHYGNCVGVPTVGGEIAFEPAYAHNCLVNAMCVGVLPRERLTSARATGPGNLVCLFGSRTGRDGIGGASVLASQDLVAGSADKRPSVQIGDPFMGKKLIECMLALLDAGLLLSLQDLGAAGLASSTAEMAARGGVGIDLDLGRVPLREPDMEPFEIMISESQERMAAIVAPAAFPAAAAVAAHHEVDATAIGEVTDTGRLRAFADGEPAGDIPVASLVDGAPRYAVAKRPPPAPRRTQAARSAARREPADAEALRTLLGAPNLASREWIYRQYDHLVGSGTVIRPGGDAAVVRLPGSPRAVAVALDGDGRRGWLDPRAGAMSAVCEAARNVACTGARPAAVTNCLNFGNPERGETGWELAEAIEGMALACEALGLPVVSGNVSLYNEHAGQPIYPTPVVGVVGVLDDAALAVRSAFAAAGDAVLLLGDGAASRDGSEFQRTVLGEVAGAPPRPDLDGERRLHALLADAAAAALLRSAHDVSGGGIAVALAEAAIWGGVGVRAEGAGDPFAEGDGRVVVSAAPADVSRLRELAAATGVAARALGEVGGDLIHVDGIALPLAEAAALHAGGLARLAEPEVGA